MKYFKQIIIQQKGDISSNDFRSFALVDASDGTAWELREYGITAAGAAGDVWSVFMVHKEEDWCLYGEPYNECKV